VSNVNHLKSQVPNLSKTQVKTKDGNFSSPNRPKPQKYVPQSQNHSHQQLPLTGHKNSKLALGVSGPTLNQHYLEMQGM